MPKPWENDPIVEQGAGAVFMPNPTAPFEAPQAQADLQGANLSNTGKDLDNRIKILELEQQLAELRGTEREEADAETQAEAKSLRARLRSGNILQAIKDARALARQGGTGFGSLASPIPTTTARDLENAVKPILATLAFDRLQEMRDESKTGGALGAVSERELDLLQSAVASLDTGQSQAAFLDNLARIEKHFVGSQLALTGVEPDSERGRTVFKEYGIGGGLRDGDVPPTGGADSRPENYRLGIADRFATDTDKKVSRLVQSAFDNGASGQELNDILRQYGYPTLNPREINAAIQYRDQGGEGVRVNVPESGMNDPTIMDRALQNLGSSPVGSYFGGAANALTMGGIDEIQGLMAGDTLGEAFSGTGQGTAEANLRKSLQAEANPVASFTGNLTGGVLGALGVGGAMGAGKAASTLAPRALAADATFGAGYGFGESNEDRLGGAALGAVAGAGGGALGRGVTRQIGNAIGGVGGPAQTLREAGVRMTPGQIGESSGGLLGRTLKRREDRLAGYSGIGDAIGRQQEQGLRQFNRAAFKEGVGEVPPEIGEEGIQYLNENVVPRAYSVLDGQQFSVDQVARQGMRDARKRGAQALGELGGEFENTYQTRVLPFVDDQGSVDGRNMQAMLQGLRKDSASMSGKPRSDIFSEATGMAEDSIGGMVERQAPGVMGQFADANATYRNTRILEDAVGRGMNTEGVFTPAQLGMASRQNAKKFGGNYASPTRPFFDLQRAGQQVLPSKIPDSGTAGRQAAGDGIVGAAQSFARNLRAPIYSDTVLDVLNTIALDRTPAARALGEEVRRNARRTGLFGAPAATIYATR